MRLYTSLGTVALVVCLAGCQNPMAPQPERESRPAAYPRGVNLQTGQSNRCRGEITSEIASDWPWPDDKETFGPPPGAVKRFLETFGPMIGISSVRELQESVCSG